MDQRGRRLDCLVPDVEAHPAGTRLFERSGQRFAQPLAQPGRGFTVMGPERANDLFH